MGISKYIEDVIDKYENEILHNIPIKDLMYDFEADKILNEYDIEKLENIPEKEKLNYKFLEILRSREDDDFYKFCKILQKNRATAIKNFGSKLEKQARGNNSK